MHTAKKTTRLIMKISWLMLFVEIMGVYSENYIQPINTLQIY
jgi:hypothetical protein